ncbi:MAG: hypothetical protein HY619_05025 [Thaumarchaeota archaeon]|nr:hypothetical protein [Nitrososphaerota archaeon]
MVASSLRREGLASRSLPLETFRVVIIVGAVSPILFLLYEVVPQYLTVPLFVATWIAGFAFDVLSTKGFFTLEHTSFAKLERNRAFSKMVARLGFMKAVAAFFVAVEVPLALLATLVLYPAFVSLTQGGMRNSLDALQGFWATSTVFGILHLDAAVHNYHSESRRRTHALD